MKVILAASGGGSAGSITEDCRNALLTASCVIGAPRLLENLPEECTRQRIAAIKPQAILEAIQSNDGECCTVLYSGDTGFYSGVRSLVPLLKEAGISFSVLPGISSVQMLSAALGRPWQDWLLMSAHGVNCNPVGAVMQGKPVFFLTGGELTPTELCRQLVQAGLEELPVTVGENLSYPDQNIRMGLAGEFAQEEFSPLSVLLAEPAPQVTRRMSGFPDDLFLRDEVPMTKQEVRAAILAKLSPRPEDVLWDIGAGTGSVSIELALASSWGHTYAIECNDKACELIQANRKKLGAWNLQLVKGRAPQALKGLETPDAVFIGGTKGSMKEIVAAVLEQNPKAKFCISAICIETVYQAVQALQIHGIEPEITQISVSRGKLVGSLHLLTANNPVFLIAGQQN